LEPKGLKHSVSPTVSAFEFTEEAMDFTTFMQKREQAALAYCQGEASALPRRPKRSFHDDA
jgi:hypothetical protein